MKTTGLTSHDGIIEDSDIGSEEEVVASAGSKEDDKTNYRTKDEAGATVDNKTDEESYKRFRMRLSQNLLMGYQRIQKGSMKVRIRLGRTQVSILT